MKKLVTTFVKYPFYANVIILIIIVSGLLGLLNMKKSFFPERTSRDIFVSMAYPGASPKEMEEALTARIEEAVRGIIGIKEINSTSLENFATVQITTTGEYDLDETLMEVKNAVDSISAFPVDAERPVVSKQRPITRAMFMGLSGDVDMLTLKKYATQIETDLLASGVVSQVSYSGLPPIEISVEVSEQNLLRYNLTFDEIAVAIARNNRDISAGMIKSDEEEMLIRSRSRSVDPVTIGDIVLRAFADGSQIRIRDVGAVKTKFSDTTSNRTLLSGKQAVFFTVSKLSEEDLEEISAFVHDYVDDFNAKHKGVKLEITFDFLTVLGSRLSLLYRNGGIGLILVIVALGLFLNLRLSFWVAWGIPASFLLMFVVAAMMGVTINMISLFGMILVVGILVDDGIVIGENIYTHFEKGKSPKRAAIDGTMEVLPAVTTSVTTTIVAFLPLFFLSGMMEFMYEMAFVVVFSLAFSLLEAFFVLPAHVGTPHVLRAQKRAGRATKIRGKLDKIVTYMKYTLYGRLLKKIIKWKWIAVTVPMAIIIITAGLFAGEFIKVTFFPAITFDNILINLAFKPGAGEKQTLQYLEQFEDKVWVLNDELKKEHNLEEDFVRYTSLTLGRTFDGSDNGAHAGNVNVMLRDMEGSPISSFEISDRLRKKIGRLETAEKLTIGNRSRWGSPVAVTILSPVLSELEGAKAMLKEGLKDIPAIKNISDNNPLGKQEVRLKLKPQAYFLGLDHAAISNQVRQGFFGGQAQRLQSGKDELRVWVRYPRTGRMNLGQLETMKIKTPRGEYPLSELAFYDIQRGPVSIKRYNMSKEVTVEADLVDPYAPVPPILEKVANDILPKIKSKYPHVRFVYQGQQKASREAMGDLTSTYGIAFGIIILILMVHFKSFSQPVIILMMIPMSWVGAAWGHGLEGIPLSMLSAWGMVALSGVIINDAVVFLSKYNNNLKEGMDVEDAVYDAGTARFRAILLTSITTVAGLYPIVLEGSFQAQFLKPMAIALAYGVLFGTLFILLFLPSLILVLGDLRKAWKWVWTGKKLTPESLEPAVIMNQSTID